MSNRDLKPYDVKRAERVWMRFTNSYGTRWADNFGPTPSDDWIRAVAAASNDQVTAALIAIRNKHISHPPTLPEFEAALRAAKPKADAPRAPDVRDRLVALALRSELSAAQMNSKWLWLTRADPTTGAVGFYGVVIQADLMEPAKYRARKFLTSDLNDYGDQP
jgi:hypothetical protein